MGLISRSISKSIISAISSQPNKKKEETTTPKHQSTSENPSTSNTNQIMKNITNIFNKTKSISIQEFIQNPMYPLICESLTDNINNNNDNVKILWEIMANIEQNFPNQIDMFIKFLIQTPENSSNKKIIIKSNLVELLSFLKENNFFDLQKEFLNYYIIDQQNNNLSLFIANCDLEGINRLIKDYRTYFAKTKYQGDFLRKFAYVMVHSQANFQNFNESWDDKKKPSKPTQLSKWSCGADFGGKKIVKKQLKILIEEKYEYFLQQNNIKLQSKEEKQKIITIETQKQTIISSATLYCPISSETNIQPIQESIDQQSILAQNNCTNAIPTNAQDLIPYITYPDCSTENLNNDITTQATISSEQDILNRTIPSSQLSILQAPQIPITSATQEISTSNQETNNTIYNTVSSDTHNPNTTEKPLMLVLQKQTITTQTITTTSDSKTNPTYKPKENNINNTTTSTYKTMFNLNPANAMQSFLGFLPKVSQVTQMIGNGINMIDDGNSNYGSKESLIPSKLEAHNISRLNNLIPVKS